MCVFVGTCAVYAKETIEYKYLASGGEGVRRIAHLDEDGGLLKLCIGHLCGDGTFPYQFVETALGCSAFDGLTIHIGGTYGLVGFLGAFDLGLEIAQRMVLLSHGVNDNLLAGSKAEAREIRRVGTHIGDLS